MITLKIVKLWGELITYGQVQPEKSHRGLYFALILSHLSYYFQAT